MITWISQYDLPNVMRDGFTPPFKSNTWFAHNFANNFDRNINTSIDIIKCISKLYNYVLFSIVICHGIKTII